MSYLNQELLQFISTLLQSKYFWTALPFSFLWVYLWQKASDLIHERVPSLVLSVIANLFAVSLLFVLFLWVPLIVLDMYPIPKTSTGGKWVIGVALGGIAAKFVLYFRRNSRTKSTRL
jgi:hypothetical protein